MEPTLTGRLLDERYRVGSVIARGGMATVYEGSDERLGRQVAIKVLHASLANDSEFVGRFRSEARAAVKLAHPNMVSVYDQGDDPPYLVMEFVPGRRTMRDLIRDEAPLSARTAMDLIDPVLTALAAAHKIGMVHRDIKPENVLIAPDGRIKVTDFGLARAVNAETQHTAHGGVLIGTVSYMAPERVADGTADGRADVYAVGVMLFELLTGQKPHQADTPLAVAYKHVNEDVPRVSSVLAGQGGAAIPDYVDALVARATAREADQRPSDAGVLLRMVRQVRQALIDGAPHDPELAANLAPRRIAEPAEAPGPEDTGELTEPLLVPPTPADHEPTTRVEVGLGGPVLPPPPGSPLPQGPLVAGRPVPQRSRRGPLMLVLILVATLAVAGGAYWVGIARYTTAPGLQNLSAKAAETKAAEAGLTLEIGDPVYSETVPKNSVVRTDPGAGDRILKGGVLTAHLSLGPERYQVPKVRNKPEAEAVALIEDKLSVGRIRRQYDEQIAEGHVMRANPRAGTSLKPNAAVDLVISRGRKPLKITDLTGKNGTNAINVLRKRGFNIELTRSYSETVEEGLVIAQSPKSGTGYRGDTIKLQVSLGKPLVTIPEIRWMRAEDAEETLEGLGLKVKVQERGGAHFGVAWDTNPKPGTQVRIGSTVTLVVR